MEGATQAVATAIATASWTRLKFELAVDGASSGITVKMSLP